MSSSTIPFALPSDLPPGLRPVKDYWDRLKRSENDMPFWDDVNLSSLHDRASLLMLIEVFSDPLRFRFNIVGDDISKCYGAPLAGKFAHSLEPKSPLNHFAAQCSVAVEARAPTYHRHGPTTVEGRGRPGYSRLILPLWGEGQVRKLFGGISFEEA
jgi:hypothetical protein